MSEELFLSNLPVIERVCRHVCRRHGVFGADAEDFAASIRLKLIENDYAILKKHRGQSSMATYLAVVIERLFLDQRIHELGKWRPSADARRSGDAAVLFERLVFREKKTAAEAREIVLRQFPDTRAEELDQLGERQRRVRARFDVTLGTVLDVASPAQTDRDLIERERQQAADVVASALRSSLAALAPEDQLLIRLHFLEGLKVSSISRMLDLDQKQTYRRIEQLLRGLRQSLESHGVAAERVRDLLSENTADLHVGTVNGFDRRSPSTQGDREFLS